MTFPHLPETGLQQFYRLGWQTFEDDQRIFDWATAAKPMALKAAADPALAHYWRHGRSWFVGVDALDNNTDGSIARVPLDSLAIDLLSDAGLTPPTWHPAQVSIVRPGYPKNDGSESPAAARFRRFRDGAHLDGLLPEGPERRRHLREPHSVILGLPLTKHSDEASPMVVWEGSHEVFRRAFSARMQGAPAGEFGNQDLTDTYQATRQEVFSACRRIAVHAKPGEAFVVHRLALHGISPWGSTAKAPPEGRMIAYFRPLLDDPTRWLSDR